MLVTTRKVMELCQFGPFFYDMCRVDHEIHRGHKLFLLKGYLYPDLNCDVDDLFTLLEKTGIRNGLRQFKGRYCGCLIDKEDRSVIIFNDQLGLYDIFYSLVNEELIVSDRFTDFFRVKAFGKDDLDAVAMAEFVLYEHVFHDRTFLKNVKLLPYASVGKFQLSNSTMESSKYWNYRFDTKPDFNKEEAFTRVDELLKQSMRRIKQLNPGKSFAIGLSGGYDSRLEGKYAIDEGIELRAFVYNYGSYSDAYHISKRLAQLLGISLKPVSIKNDYMSLKDLHIQYDPMHSIRYTTYCTVMDELPEAEALLTGFMGDNGFGSHIRDTDFQPGAGVVQKINRRALRYHGAPLFSKEIQKEINKDLKKYEEASNEHWKCCEIFDFENRQLRFIKNSPNFNFYGRYEQYYSIFADIDLMEYLLTLPLQELRNNQFYHDFYKRFFPLLAGVRGERRAYTLYDSPAIRRLKTFLLTFKMRVLAEFGIKLPIYRTIDFMGHFDWQVLFPYSGFEEKFKDIHLEGVNAQKVRQLPDKYCGPKFHYLTLQCFVDEFM